MTDRLVAWATGTLAAFSVAAFAVLYVILPATRAVAAMFDLPGSH